MRGKRSFAVPATKLYESAISSLNKLTPTSSGIRLHTPGKLNVVFIGQFYASTELEACLSVLSQNANRLGLEIVVHYFGSRNSNGRD